MPVLGRVIKGIGSGVGLASEAITHHREKNASGRDRSRSPNPQADANQLRNVDNDKLMFADEDGTPSDSDIEEVRILSSDEAQWALDDAASEVDNHMGAFPTSSHPEDAKVGTLFARCGMKMDNSACKPLPYPVIIPQRRPHRATRGFVRAYAPILESHAGISQPEFMDFLNAVDESAQVSPIFTVVNIAAFGVSLIPSPIAMAVTISLQFTSGVSEQVVSRKGRNNYLEKMNREVFMPKGLFCMIMAFKPEMADQATLSGNVSGADKALTKFASEESGDSALTKNIQKARLRSGITVGEIALPEAAPLVYPSLDAAATTNISDVPDPSGAKASNSSMQSVKAKFKSSQNFIDTYFDQRARDEYAGTYSNSKLVSNTSGQTEQNEHYTSRFSDPNHPGNSGTILGLITGGRFDPRAGGRVRLAEMRAKRSGQPSLTEDEKRNVYMGRDEGAGSGMSELHRRRIQQDQIHGITRKSRPVRKIVRRVMKPEVLYLTVVNLPSEEEMREMRRILEEAS